MKQLIEEQRKQFNQLKLNDTWYCGGNQDNVEMLNEETWNWHKQSLKQFIDGLIKVQNEQIQKELSVERFARPDFYKGYEASKNETVAHLKELKEELN